MSRRERPTGYLLLYTLGAMVLVSGLALTMMNSTLPETQLTKRRMNLQLARVAADSGIEWGLAIIDHELANVGQTRASRPGSGQTGLRGGPWVNPNYWPPPGHNWLSSTAVMNGVVGPPTNDPEVLEAPAIRLTPLMWGGEGDQAGSPSRLNTQFQLSLWPDLTYDTVKVATADDRNPTIFHLRARGEVIYDADPNANPPPDILAQATVIQTFVVNSLPSGCGMPRLTRLNWELEPANRGPIPFNIH